MRLLILLFLFISNCSFAQLTDVRKKQLDSIITNLDRSVVSDLDSVHAFIDHMGKEDSEKVFMFYGLIAIHFKYDYNRAGKKKKSVEYTPYYTAKRRKGVCRDFAALFKELCDRSEIPCLMARGNVKHPWLRKMYERITFSYNPRHAWNIVKYNGKWRLMDPTWSEILRTDKYYAYKNGRKSYKGKAKRASRMYFDASPRALYYERNASHPAYYLSETVYSFKTSLRKYKRRKIEYENYDYNLVLDSLAANPLYEYSSNFMLENIKYSKMPRLHYNIKYQFDYLKLKRTDLNPITKESCIQHLEELKKIVDYVHVNLDRDYSVMYAQHVLEVKEFMEDL